MSERLLQMTHPEPKFWAISVDGSTLSLRTGPLHTPGTTRKIECKSPAAAASTAEALITQRLKDGFREVAATSAPAAHDHATEVALLRDDPDAWLVFADSLLETTEALRGELISLHVRAARRERGSIGKTKTFLKQHFDALVGSDLAAFHKQVTIDWRFGYARTVRVWSGPHNAPIGEVLESVMQSPACRFLQRLEFGSPGNEGRYDLSLRTLAKLPWPAHLDSLFLGNFDVEAARVMGSAWPRLESLASLMPVAQRLRSLEVRAVLNTFGRALVMPKLERLMLRPTVLDARLQTDLLSFEAPLLNEFGLSSGAAQTGWAGWAQLVRKWIMLSKLKTLVLEDQPEALDLLEHLAESLKQLEVVDLTGSLDDVDAERLLLLAPVLAQAVLKIGKAPSRVVKKLSAAFPRLDVTIVEAPAPRALRRPVRARRYDEIVE